jgi:hypothetical protein
VDHKNIDRVAVLRLGGRDETPIVRIRQSDKQWFCQSEGTELCIEFQFATAAPGGLYHRMNEFLIGPGWKLGEIRHYSGSVSSMLNALEKRP